MRRPEPQAIEILRNATEDVRFFVRIIRRKWLFHVGVLLPLVVGIGSAAALLEVVDCVLLQKPPFEGSERIVQIWSTLDGGIRSDVSLPDFAEWSQRVHGISRWAAVQQWQVVIGAPDSEPQVARVGLVSGEFFDVLGATATSGRLLESGDDVAQAPCRVVLRSDFARASFPEARVGGALSLLSLRLLKSSCTIVGMVSPEMDLTAPELPRTDMWVTLAVSHSFYEAWGKNQDGLILKVLGRLAPGVSLEDAAQELREVASEITVAHPSHRLGVGLGSLREEIVGPARRRLYRMCVGIAVAFLALCFNLGGLFLVHFQERRGEFALRSALGASRSRLVRQLLTEVSLTVSLAIPAAALWSAWLARILFATLAIDHDRSWPSLHWGVRGLALAVPVVWLTAVLCALLPLLSMPRADLATAVWQSGARTGGGGLQRRLRGGLVAAQIALGCVLVTMSSAAAQAVRLLAETPLGFEPNGLTYVSFLSGVEHQDEDYARNLYATLVAAVTSQPSVRSAAISFSPPLFSSYQHDYFERADAAPGDHFQRVDAVRNIVSRGYFETLGTPVLEGRDFAPIDSANGNRAIILGESLARRLFPDQSAVGSKVVHHGWMGPLTLDVIGVVGDVHRGGWRGLAREEAYVPIGLYAPNSCDLVVRSEPGQTATVAGQIPQWLRGVDPLLVVRSVQPFPAGLEHSVDEERLLSMTLLAFAATATVLSILGVFALISSNVAYRKRELAVRLALGSPWRNILWLVVLPVLGWIATGVTLGDLVVFGLAGSVMSDLPGASALSFQTAPWAAFALLLCGLAACLRPLWKATNVAPGLALRDP